MVILEKWVEAWIDQRSIRLRPSTISGYRRILRKYVQTSPVGKLPLDEITPADLVIMLSPIVALGRTRQAQLTQIIVGAALKSAALQRIIPWNPMLCVDKIDHRAKKTAWLTAEEAETVLKAAEMANDPFYPAWELGFCCGLRRGELLGLKWADIDFAGQMIHVERQRIRVDGRIIETTPKSASSDRFIPMAEHVREMLWKRRRLGAVYVLEQHGQPVTDKILERGFAAALNRCDVRRITLHGMRHTMAATAATNGIPIKILQSIMGHAQFTTTADIYAHVDQSAARSAAQRIAAATIGARLEIA